jgi:hypothetical protein
MPIPLITYRRPWDIKEELYDNNEELFLQNQNLIFQPQIFEEIFYCFEKNNSVLNFKISSNKNKSP